MKKIKVMALVLSVFIASGCFAGCKKKVANDENTLEIYMAEGGYRSDWLYAVKDAFVAENPQYTVAIETEKGVDRIEEMLCAGPDNTTADLLFGDEKLAALQAKGENAYAGYDCVMEDLTEMYNATVPGESVMLKDKTNKYVLSQFAVEKEDDDGQWSDHYYMYSWANSLLGLVYNKTMFAEKGVTNVPRTTEELYDVLDALKDEDFAPFITSFATSYMDPVLCTWWAQYSGYSGYEKFWNPTSLNDYSSVYAYDKNNPNAQSPIQKGKLYTAQIVNQIYKPSYGRLNQDSFDTNYTEAQAKFLTRKAAIIASGDWFETEMKDLIAQNAAQGNNDEYGMMRTPLNSAIAEKLSFWSDARDYATVFSAAYADVPDPASVAVIEAADAKLRQIVDYVDGGKTGTEPDGVTDEDIRTVEEARKIIFTYGAGHQAVIPAYATAKEAAKEFLLFLASDKAQKIFAENTQGATMSYGYDPASDNIEMTDFARASLDIVKDSVICTHWSVARGYWEMGFTPYRLSLQLMASGTNDYKTPEEIFFDSIISYDEYQTALRTAGRI